MILFSNSTRFGRFRPLSGVKVSERVTNPCDYTIFSSVSVPSRGLRYLNKMFKVIVENYYECFRPLSGVKVSELYILYRLLTHIQHIVLGVSKSAFPIIITLINYTIKT